MCEGQKLTCSVIDCIAATPLEEAVAAELAAPADEKSVEMVKRLLEAGSTEQDSQ